MAPLVFALLCAPAPLRLSEAPPCRSAAAPTLITIITPRGQARLPVLQVDGAPMLQAGALASSLDGRLSVAEGWADLVVATLEFRFLLDAPFVVRGPDETLLPLAAWMTGLLQVFGDITDTLSSWLAHLVFSPKTWLGMIIGFVAIVLIGGANAIARRGKPAKADKAPSTKAPRAVGPTKTPDPLIDDEMAEIQAILKKRGIS
jgi:hypothetical protein